MASALLPYVVIATANGADLARRDGEIVSSHESLAEALDAALVANGLVVGDGVLRGEDGSKIGSFRWLDGTAEEAEPIEDGSQVTRDLIARMASMIDPASPVPMDGAEHGAAHSQLYDTSTRADGYVHAGIEGLAPDKGWPAGRWHLYERCELSPVAVRDVDLGLLAYGSIGFDPTSGRLLQHALTNVPAVTGLAPNNAIRSAGRVAFRTRRIDMTTPPKAPSKRGPAMDLINEIAVKLGLKVDDFAEDSWEAYEKLRGSLFPLIEAAKVERILEGGAPAPVEGEPVGLSADPAKAAARALPGFADDAAQETFTSEALGILRDIFGQAEGEPASVLDMLKASAAAFKGAIQTAPDPAASDAQATADAAALTSSAEPAVRSLSSKVEALTNEIAKRDVRDDIERRFRAADVSMPKAEDIETLVVDALKLDAQARSRFVDMAVSSRTAPPKGDVFGKRSAPEASSGDVMKAIEDAIPALRAQYPNEPGHELFARARRAVEKKFPALS